MKGKIIKEELSQSELKQVRKGHSRQVFFSLAFIGLGVFFVLVLTGVVTGDNPVDGPASQTTVAYIFKTIFWIMAFFFIGRGLFSLVVETKMFRDEVKQKYKFILRGNISSKKSMATGEEGPFDHQVKIWVNGLDFVLMNKECPFVEGESVEIHYLPKTRMVLSINILGASPEVLRALLKKLGKTVGLRRVKCPGQAPGY